MTHPAKPVSRVGTARLERPAPLVDIRSPWFFPRYAAKILQGMLRRHRPCLHDAHLTSTYRARTQASTIARWHQFAEHQQVDLPVPFTYLNSGGAFCLAQLLGHLRINFTQVLHQKAAIQLTQPVSAIQANEIYTLHMRIHEVIPLNHRALLVTETDILNRDGLVVRRHLDHWHVRNTHTQLPKTPHPDVLVFRRLSQRAPSWESWPAAGTTFTRFHLPISAARRYARISGDYTPHATGWGARLFGQPRPFMQGFGLLNLSLHHLTQALGQELGELDITFARPVLTGQEITLYANDGRFEVCGAHNELLAFGRFSAASLKP